jgi:hypothetical protein
MDCTFPEDEKLELDFNIDSDGEPPEDQIGDIRNVIRYKNEKIVRKEILKCGSGLEKPGKPYIVTIHAHGYTKDKFEFLPLVKNINMTLGDLRLPTGLWKSVEHMKKGECGKIWIKPGEYGFGRTKNPDVLQWPTLVKDDEELKNKLKNEEIYYEIELVEWIVRADLLGDSQMIKTYETVATGYDRCGDDDDIDFDYKVIKLDSQSVRHTIEEGKDQHLSMTNFYQWGDVKSTSKFTFTFAKVLKTMKLGEKSSTIVLYSYLENKDQKAIEKYNVTPDERLMYEIEFKKVLKVEDYYHDGEVYKKVLRAPKSTASPFTDSWVEVNIKVAYRPLYEGQEEEVLMQTTKPIRYTLDDYTFPPLLRDMLKSLKNDELAEVHTIRKKQCIPEFEDEEHGHFASSWFDKVGEIDEKTGETNWMVFTIEMTDFDSPEAMHALFFHEKLPRLLRIKALAIKFFKKQDWAYAYKIYYRLWTHYNLKDIYNNLQKEDEESSEYKEMKAELEKLQLQTLTNILVTKSKLEHWNDVVEMSEKALVLDPVNIKALFFRGRAYLNLLEFDSATELFK